MELQISFLKRSILYLFLKLVISLILKTLKYLHYLFSMTLVPI